MICKLEITNTLIYITSQNYILQHISKKFTYKDYSEAFVRGKFQKHNVKIIKLLKFIDKHHAALPIGLKNELLELLDSIGSIEYRVYDKRDNPDFNFTSDNIKNCLKEPLRDYQIEAVQSFLKHKNTIIKGATGSGKTKIMAAIVKLLNKKALILMHKKDLVHQTYRRFVDDGIQDVGFVQGNNFKDGNILLATIQSSHKIDPDFIKTAELVIVDECQHANAPTFQTVLMLANNARYRLGLSATPFNKNKLHNARVKAWIGDIGFDLGAKKLVEAGWLAKPLIKLVPIKKVEIVNSKGRRRKVDIEEYSWIGAERNGVIKNMIRNEKIASIAKFSKKPVLILVKSIKHGEFLKSMIDNSTYIHGDTSLEDRKKIIEEFEKHKIPVLIASTILDEGIDIINIKSLIVAAGGKSFIKTIQRLGRALRKSPTKDKVYIYDFLDKTNRLLERHSYERIKAYEREGFTDIEVI